MPFQIRKEGLKFVLVNTDSGKRRVHSTRSGAESQRRLLQGIKAGTLKPRKEK